MINYIRRKADEAIRWMTQARERQVQDIMFEHTMGALKESIAQEMVDVDPSVDEHLFTASELDREGKEDSAE